MKLFILHLSDIHFEKESDYEETKVCGIVNALKLDKSIEAIEFRFVEKSVPGGADFCYLIVR